jgi:hypothetical protein
MSPSTGNDSVTVMVEITASSNTGDKIDAMMSGCGCEYLAMTGDSTGGNYIQQGDNTPLRELKGLTKNLVNFNSRIKIDYRRVSAGN